MQQQKPPDVYSHCKQTLHSRIGFYFHFLQFYRRKVKKKQLTNKTGLHPSSYKIKQLKELNKSYCDKSFQSAEKKRLIFFTTSSKQEELDRFTDEYFYFVV